MCNVLDLGHVCKLNKLLTVKRIGDQFFVFCSLEQALRGLLDAQLSQKFQSFFDRYLTIYYILIYL